MSFGTPEKRAPPARATAHLEFDGEENAVFALRPPELSRQHLAPCAWSLRRRQHDTGTQAHDLGRGARGMAENGHLLHPYAPRGVTLHQAGQIGNRRAQQGVPMREQRCTTRTSLSWAKRVQRSDLLARCLN